MSKVKRVGPRSSPETGKRTVKDGEAGQFRAVGPRGGEKTHVHRNASGRFEAVVGPERGVDIHPLENTSGPTESTVGQLIAGWLEADSRDDSAGESTAQAELEQFKASMNRNRGTEEPLYL